MGEAVSIRNETANKYCGEKKDDAIMEFHDGYRHVINEDFSNLSGGQKQRLALARMFLSKKPLFLIDEGTANLDEETGRSIIEHLAKQRGEKTIIMITHDKQAVPYADYVYQL